MREVSWGSLARSDPEDRRETPDLLGPRDCQDCQESQDCKDVPKVGLELECLLFPMINVTAGKLSEGSQNGLQRCYGTRVQGKEGLQLG